MTTIDGLFLRSQPTTFRVTVLDNDEDNHLLTRSTDRYPDSSRRYVPDRYTSDSITFHGSHCARELSSSGNPTGHYELLTQEEFREQYIPKSYEYAVQLVDRPRDVTQFGGDLCPLPSGCFPSGCLVPSSSSGRTMRPIIESLVHE